MRKKGFTLIELLAVIVVLAIIALIAVPLVLNTIEEARQGAAKASGYTYISEVEKGLATYMTKNSGANYTPGPYTISTLGTDLEILLKGDTPSEGNICIGSNGTVTNASLKINGYVINYDGKEMSTIESDNIESINCEGQMILGGYPILNKAKALVYAEDGETCKIDADATDTTTYKYMGGCYIKGASTNNYVWYNGFMWRIMGINSDNTVRLITDENVTALAYGASGTAENYATNSEYIRDWLNDEENGVFYKNLNSTKSIIKKGKYFCSQITDDYTVARQSCDTDYQIDDYVGLISSDEVLLAIDNKTSYLDIGQSSWTMTPESNNSLRGYGSGGTFTQYGYKALGVRPIINVDSNAVITSGDGTVQNFYALGEDKSTNITGKLKEKVTSGEYVTLKGKTYRVVGKETDGVKLILDSFYETDLAYESQRFTTESKIGAKLNSDVLEWLGVDDSQIVSTTYYQGTPFREGFQYTLPLSTGYEIENVKVGLIRLGEMLASQSATMLTNNYTVASNNGNAKTYWTLNIHNYATNNRCWAVVSSGNASEYYVGNAYAIRPVIVVRNDLDITGGTGTWNNPYQI